MRNILETADPEVWAPIGEEERRQREGLELIASENYVSPAVLAANGTVLTNKYAEGGPGRRYYGGCENVDVIEQLAIDRAKQLFGAEHANVQPHSGSQANMAAYFAAGMLPSWEKVLLDHLEASKHGEVTKILIKQMTAVMVAIRRHFKDHILLAQNLAHGGHLTHGNPVNFSGKLFKVVPYGVDQTHHRIDMDEVARLAKEHKGHVRVILAGYSSYPRQITDQQFATFRQIADDVGAIFVVDMAHFAGLVAGGVHANPVQYASYVTSTTHKTMRGPRGGFVLSAKDLPGTLEHFLKKKEKPEEYLAKKLDSAVFPGMQGGPLMHTIAAKAVCFGEALKDDFKTYAAQIIANAKVLAETLAKAGFRLISGGTDNHLMSVDVTAKKGVTGKIAEQALDHAGITVNKNMIPFDPRKPMDPSGIRIGTPAVTTRGMKEPEMKLIGEWIARVLDAPDDAALQQQVRGAIKEVCQHFPVPGEEK